MAVGQITSQPAAHAQVGKVLTPAITVHHLAADPTATYFAMPVLLSTTGEIVNALQGNKNTTGSPMNGGASVKFTFTDLAISVPGKYSIRLDIYMLYEGATLMDRVILDQITVSD